MKPLSAERKYMLEVIDPETGRKTPPITIELGQLVGDHNKALAECIKDGTEDKDFDPYVNIFFDVTDGFDKADEFMRIPILRMSSVRYLINQEQVQ